MLRHTAYVGLIAAALAAPPAFAETAAGQTTTDKMAPAAQATTPANPPAASQNAAPAPKPETTTQASANPTFITQQAKDQWRAGKLVGVAVYGKNQKKVGSVKDILMDHEGNAQAVVISIGGFLGIGSKDVAVPFKAMQWQTEGRAAATNPPPASTSGTGNGMTPNQGAAQPAQATQKESPADVEASQGYPDRGVIAMTEAQLKSAPDFHYASDNTANGSNAPASNGTKQH
ncbi:MAG TPA: PRC-barrel domain-containing protein [Roseiarcus sp.]|nr:PRC-barrel domain-containing protein [Roseiarcus sp.]